MKSLLRWVCALIEHDVKALPRRRDPETGEPLLKYSGICRRCGKLME